MDYSQCDSQFPDFSTQQSQISDDESEIPIVAGKKRAPRGAGYSIDEDKLLVSAWLNTSVDAVLGNERKRATFWEQVWDYFHKHKEFDSARSPTMLKQRWLKIQRCVNKFCGCLDGVIELNRSGKSEQDRIADAKVDYLGLYNSHFTLDHAWILLRYQPKWAQLRATLPSSSSNPTTPINIEENNFNNNAYDPSERPPGRKAEKRKMKQISSDKATPKEDEIQKLLEEKKERDEKKMQLLNQKLEQDAKKIKLKTLQTEMYIMGLDTSIMSEEERAYYAKKKMEILSGGLGDGI